MENQKGFSLVEVCLSLLLTTTIVFMLLHAHLQAHFSLKRWVARSKALSVFDQDHERRVLKLQAYHYIDREAQ